MLTDQEPEFRKDRPSIVVCDGNRKDAQLPNFVFEASVVHRIIPSNGVQQFTNIPKKKLGVKDAPENSRVDVGWGLRDGFFPLLHGMVASHMDGETKRIYPVIIWGNKRRLAAYPTILVILRRHSQNSKNSARVQAIQDRS